VDVFDDFSVDAVFDDFSVDAVFDDFSVDAVFDDFSVDAVFDDFSVDAVFDDFSVDAVFDDFSVDAVFEDFSVDAVDSVSMDAVFDDFSVDVDDSVSELPAEDSADTPAARIAAVLSPPIRYTGGSPRGHSAITLCTGCRGCTGPVASMPHFRLCASPGQPAAIWCREAIVATAATPTMELVETHARNFIAE
jgi:hypothetical protein